ncbi:unnamed protein product [Vitrella brassicaformis CCMP3155]|uniref:FAD-dependent oxidoreductase n=1 Tax=Vitrella brassicaformis (strain CCMP3155) TaxID=1169540 RepID=A0A0G4H1M2_VITBC|nr:unnamed protein product [Vitrella brassicaformis CCMP3155]|eukprot:CEM37500.1 unnamed protein product [Vitrella brassicaformis CCMP3155]
MLLVTLLKLVLLVGKSRSQESQDALLRDEEGVFTRFDKGKEQLARSDVIILDKSLKPGEHPRSTKDDPVGKGLLTRHLEADVVVAGGGSAGTSAALAAARSGAKTVLIQARGVLGGNMSSESKLHPVGADHLGNRGVELETGAREGGIIEEYTL